MHHDLSGWLANLRARSWRIVDPAGRHAGEIARRSASRSGWAVTLCAVLILAALAVGSATMAVLAAAGRTRAGQRAAAAWARASTTLGAQAPRTRLPIALATAVVLTAGLVAGLAAFADPAPGGAAAGDAAAADPIGRQQAANRADRSARGTRVPAAAKPPAAKQPAGASKAAAPQAAAKPAAKKAAPKWVSPMPRAPLSSCFGLRWGRLHRGLDFAGANGSAIRSVGAGRVLGAGWLYSGYGISVVVDHRNGYLSHYAHAQRVLVRPGQWVKPGQALALEGSTGDSTGPHLHFEIHNGMWRQVNPATWLRKRGVAIGC